MTKNDIQEIINYEIEVYRLLKEIKIKYSKKNMYS